MNVIALGLANGSFANFDFPFRDACVLALLCSGVALLLAACYLLLTGCTRSVIPADPIRVDD